jgi:hypothetical protein
MDTLVGFTPAPTRAAGCSPTNLVAAWLITCTISVVSWILCETLGGLIFLALGIRLWAYQITPIFWGIASYTGWIYVFFIVGTGCFAYLLGEHGLEVRGPRRWLYRSLFLVIAGPVTEVIWNHATWNVLDIPLYLYTELPTFSGSGSWLSPLYYQTLLLGFWMEEWFPRSLAYQSRAR